MNYKVYVTIIMVTMWATIGYMSLYGGVYSQQIVPIIAFFAMFMTTIVASLIVLEK